MTHIFYPSELPKHGWQWRPRDKIIYKKFENSKLCPMAATIEYLKCRAEYDVAHTIIWSIIWAWIWISYLKWGAGVDNQHVESFF